VLQEPIPADYIGSSLTVVSFEACEAPHEFNWKKRKELELWN